MVAREWSCRRKLKVGHLAFGNESVRCSQKNLLDGRTWKGRKGVLNIDIQQIDVRCNQSHSRPAHQKSIPRPAVAGSAGVVSDPGMRSLVFENFHKQRYKRKSPKLENEMSDSTFCDRRA